jgi:hypothetical protein
MTYALPRSALLAWVLTAWLGGRLSTDDAIDWLSDELDVLEDGGQLLDLLTLVRRSGSAGAGLALPREGDLLGLGGPAELNRAALEAGEAVVLTGLALVPAETGDAVTWSVHPAAPRQLVDVGEADRRLRATLTTTTEELVRLDVARWRPEVADELMGLHRPPELEAPDGIPARCVTLAARGLVASDVVRLALADDGAAVSAAEADLRRRALAGLEQAARAAVVAACSADAWP